MAMRGKYAGHEALDPFFEVIEEGLKGLVQGEHFFDTIAEDALFEFLYDFPGWPRIIRGRASVVDQFSGYGDNIRLHASGRLAVHRSQDPRVVILEYELHGKPSRRAQPTTTSSSPSSRSRTRRSCAGGTTWTRSPHGWR